MTTYQQTQPEAAAAFGQALFSHIVKRDGRQVPFDAAKITLALQKAGQATGEFSPAIANRLTIRVLTLCQAVFNGSIPSVEQIQDIVEEVLLSSPYKKTAKAYILYRDQHARNREMVDKADMALIDQYLEQLDWKVNENSNMTYSLQGLNNYVASEISQVYWLNRIYTPEVRQAHTSGDFHIHDLGQLSVYCVGWDLQDLLREGFRGVYGKSESAPAKHLSSALGQIVNFFYTLQGEAAGAQAFSSFDTLLAPFVRYGNMSASQVKQALQEFVFNLNVPTRVGFQSPFTNLTLDLKPPRLLAGEPVIIGGKPQQACYGDFQAEMNLLNKAFLEVLAAGDAKGRVFTFPIPTYNITADFDWDTPDLEKLWEVTARYGIPYFANFVNSDMSPDDARSMCGRLRLDTRVLEKKGGGLFGSAPLTGSIGVVTLNMARIGYLADSEADFLVRPDRLMEIARASLDTKRKVIERFTEQNLYPYSNFYLRNMKQRNGSYWFNHFSTIGVVGMNEACLNFLDADIGTQKGVAFALRVMDHMRARIQQFQEESGDFYNLEATPAESTAYRLARLDQEKYPNCRCANTSAVAEGAEPFYTNSTQLPVNYSNDVFEVLDLQDELQTRYTGGTVQHVFLGEAVSDPEAVKRFVRTVCEKYRLPYFTLSPTFSICPQHGYLNGLQETCPQCGAATEVFSRVVGYLRPISQWNDGKQAEFSLRRTYSVEENQ